MNSTSRDTAVWVPSVVVRVSSGAGGVRRSRPGRASEAAEVNGRDEAESFTPANLDKFSHRGQHYANTMAPRGPFSRKCRSRRENPGTSVIK